MIPATPRNAPRYVVISPVRDEEQYLENTMRSMVQQTVRPAQWIVVDDGSTDGTAEIIHRYSSTHSWITGVHLKDGYKGPVSARGTRACLAKEIEAFYAGYEKIIISDWEYLAKIDGDVGFPPDYFERCIGEFEANTKVGIGGGLICNVIDGEMCPEPTPLFHVRGATKIYRRQCWEALGGVERGPAWDTLDEVKSNMLGWQTFTFSDLRVAHYRYTGRANGAWRNSVKVGLWSYIAGYHPLYMLARSARRILEPPFFVSSLGLLCGFFSGYLRRVPQTDKHLIRYIRAQQLRRLALLPTIWK